MLSRDRIILVCVLLGSLATVLAVSSDGGLGDRESQLQERASESPPDGYGPNRFPGCPVYGGTVREAKALSPKETEWLQLRQNKTIPALKAVLARADLERLDTDAYIDKIVSKGGAVPRIAIALSGGGYRALMNGAGALAAFDDRTKNAVKKGQLGGLLQATTYLSGLSGGAWLLASLYAQNFTSVESIISPSSGPLSKLWRFDGSIVDGPQGLSAARYYYEIHQDVKDKYEAKDKHDISFNTTIADYWGLALSYQLINASDGRPGHTFSSIAQDVEFAEGREPLPIIVALQRPLGKVQLPENSTVFEFTPWEMGSYDPGVAAFAPLKFAGGSKFIGGTLPRGGLCFTGYDRTAFIMATSSSLFNEAFLQLSKASRLLKNLLPDVYESLVKLSRKNKDVAIWPNPFYKYKRSSNETANSRYLTLVDGGEDLQNIPLHPLTISERHVDVVFAIDSSADTTTRWPNGTSLVATYKHSKSGFSTSNSKFPRVPDQNTFVNLGLNKRPTFFGCDSKTSAGPLIVYLPNAPYTYQSNFSTFDLEYSDDERDRIILNGYNVATMGNGAVDAEWPSCVSCAVLARSLARTQTAVPATCVDCFARYCWNGTTDSRVPARYEPERILTSGIA
ncbi:Lysophospholipase 1 [Neonectria ditissima]|uniref:Lysophospholipase n=1 Tax=Neonectria ditissima TaxID=78410 RepID=A0A0P7BN49_9HYPO|nr:Lysophospholipase 1 [Neonectria ditissima]